MWRCFIKPRDQIFISAARASLQQHSEGDKAASFWAAARPWASGAFTAPWLRTPSPWAAFRGQGPHSQSRLHQRFVQMPLLQPNSPAPRAWLNWSGVEPRHFFVCCRVLFSFISSFLDDTDVQAELRSTDVEEQDPSAWFADHCNHQWCIRNWNSGSWALNLNRPRSVKGIATFKNKIFLYDYLPIFCPILY